MSGNVLEWCQDYWHDHYQNAPSNGDAWLVPISSYRVLRGGSWYIHGQYSRSAWRTWSNPANRFNYEMGFRLALTP